jgi:hypothetical protein
MDVTVDAVRARIKRETISHVREGGRVYVILDTDQDYASRDQDHGQYTDQGSAQPETGPDYRDELVEALRDQVAFLRRELEARTEEARRKDHIIMSLTQWAPALAPPRDEPRATETDAETGEGTDTPPDRSGGETGVQRRSWWRRWWFGIES